MWSTGNGPLATMLVKFIAMATAYSQLVAHDIYGYADSLDAMFVSCVASM